MSENLKGGINGPHGQNVKRTDDWLTPQHIIKALGPFDLDPCAAPEPRPWPTAKAHWSRPRIDGLARAWRGRVWMNPPYGTATGEWVAKLAQHGNGIALVFARTDTRFWHDEVFAKADAILFLDGRLTFCYPDGTAAGANSGGPSALVAFGKESVTTLERCGLPGKLFTMWRGQK